LLKGKHEEISFDKIKDFFKTKRPGMVEGVVITGGEPTIQKDIEEIIHFFNTEIGLKLKLDTNGACPEVIEKAQVDYIALDFKTDRKTYQKLTSIENIYDNILETLNVLMVRDIPYELRITAAPNFINMAKLENMVKDIPKGARIRLQAFKNTNCLDPSMKDIKVYSEDGMEKFRTFLKGLGFILL